MRIFIASPLGFADSTRLFMPLVEEGLRKLGHEPVNPWTSSSDLEAEFINIERMEDRVQQQRAYHDLSLRIAERNAERLRSCAGVLAILDGVDVDSGTASEIGYAFGLGGRVINGLRTDFRRSGENAGVRINLQVQYWIEASGGRIVTTLTEMNTLSFDKGR